MTKGIRFFLTCVALSLATTFALAGPATAQARIGLVVGVQAYDVDRLENPVADASLIRDALVKAGFEIPPALLNPTPGKLREAIRQLAEEARTRGPDTTVVFYYTGHAVQFGDQNYMIGVGTDLLAPTATGADFMDQGVRAQYVLDSLVEAKVSRVMMILDACRTSPSRVGNQQVSLQRGLARMQAGGDTMIVFSAEPNTSALDGVGRGNSVFATAFAESIVLPGLDVADVFYKVKAQVRRESRERQTPHIEGLFPFVFTGGVQRSSGGVAGSSLGVSEARMSGSEDATVILAEVLKTSSIAQLTKAADEGDGFAMYLLAVAYLDGKGGLNKSLSEARYWARMSTAQGVPRAAGLLGVIACCEDPARKDDVEAADWFRVGDRLGSPGATRNLGVSYRDGLGVPKDLKEAERLFMLAGQRGSGQAYENAAWLHREKEYGLVDYPKARRLHRMALDLNYFNAASSLAVLDQWGIDGPKNVPAAIAVLEEAAGKGCAFCLRELGGIYSDPTSGVADPVKASSYFLRAAEAGDGEAMLTIGRRLRKGEGIPQDQIAGFTWYARARDAGVIEAAGAMGKALAEGEGVKRDPERAATLLEEALSNELDPDKRFKIYVPNYWGFGLALAQLHETKAIRKASDAEAARLYARYGKKGSALKRFTVPITCGDVPGTTPFHVYVIDWDRPVPSTDEQWEWLKSERGCEPTADVIESFRKLYAIAKEKKVSFADLAVYALGAAQAENPAKASDSRPAHSRAADLMPAPAAPAKK